jgi:hypothetical protein
MPHFIQQLNENTLAVTFVGVLDQVSYTAAQQAAHELILKKGKISALIILKDFGGFSRGVDWGSLDFYGQHADDIVKMAFVGDPKWKVQAAIFTGAGTRKTEIKFFAPAEFGQARTWLGTA